MPKSLINEDVTFDESHAVIDMVMVCKHVMLVLEEMEPVVGEEEAATRRYVATM